MSRKTSKDERDILKRLCNDATPGPWHCFNVDDDSSMNVLGVMTGTAEPNFETGEAIRGGDNGHENIIALMLLQSPRLVDHESGRWRANADFIAAARNSMPVLLDHIELQDKLLAVADSTIQQLYEELCKAQAFFQEKKEF